MKRFSIVIFISFLIAASFTAAGCKAANSQKSLGSRIFFIIKSYNTGSYYFAGSALSRLITADKGFIGVNSTSSIIENEKIRMLIENRAQVAFIKGPEANLAYYGDPVYWEKAQPIRALFALWPAVYSLIAHTESGISKIEDIKGKSIAINSENSVAGDLLEFLLQFYGINRSNTEIYRIRESIGISMFMLKEVDCIWYDLGYGENYLKSPFFVDSKAENYVLVPVEPDENIREFLKIYPYFYLKDSDKSKGSKKMMQLMTPSVAVCSDSMPEDVVYRITKLWWENADFIEQYVPDTLGLINRKDNREGVPIAFHKGALRYMIEAGLIPTPGF